MSTTLLIPLVGPLQAWGLDSRFELRHTGTEPSKSGVLGLCCAALGRDRSEAIDDLAALLFGVRIDREGRLTRDFHTAMNVIGASGSERRTVVSTRWYLADAAFWSALEGPEDLLKSIHLALQNPHWPIHLGRRSCPPSIPPGSGALLPLPLAEALQQARLLTASSERCRIVIEDPDGPQARPDQPVAPFSQRRFGTRRVRTFEHVIAQPTESESTTNKTLP